MSFGGNNALVSGGDCFAKFGLGPELTIGTKKTAKSVFADSYEHSNKLNENEGFVTEGSSLFGTSIDVNFIEMEVYVIEDVSQE